MGYRQFALFPFILPSITPMPFPIKLPDDAGSPLPTLAPAGSPPGRKNDEKYAYFEVKTPPSGQSWAVKSLAISTPPHHFPSHQKQNRQASKIHAHQCILRLVSSARTHEISHASPQKKGQRTTFFSYDTAKKPQKHDAIF